jgi:hypothetical protein
MRILHILAHVWPGLPLLWHRGSWLALGLAFVYALAVNGALLANFVFPEHCPGWLRGLACLGAMTLSGVSLWRLANRSREASAYGDVNYEGLFIRAQAEYLKGNWPETEALLRSMLRRVPEDVDARLLLASLLRRRGERRAARKELRRLAATPRSDKWQWELVRERQLAMGRRKPAARGLQEENGAGPAASMAA